MTLFNFLQTTIKDDAYLMFSMTFFTLVFFVQDSEAGS